MTYPDGQTVSYGYDAMDRLVSVKEPDGKTTKYEYDALGRRIATEGANEQTSYAYDEVGNLVSQTSTGAYELALEYAYDLAGRMTQESCTDNGTTVTSKFAYDALRQLVKTVYPDGSESASTYDNSGNVISATDAAGGKAEAAYDGRGRLTATTDELGNETAYEYDLNGNLVAQVLATGDEIRYTYDSRNRLIAMEAAGESLRYEYDAAGNVTRSLAGGVETRREYDKMSRLVYQKDAEGFETRYRYDVAGNAVWIRDGYGETVNEFDALGRVITVTDAETGEVKFRYEYDAAGKTAAVYLADGGMIRYTYDERGERTGYEYVEPERQPSGMAKGAHYKPWQEEPLGKISKVYKDESWRLIAETEAEYGLAKAQKAATAAEAAYAAARADAPGTATARNAEAAYRETKQALAAAQGAYNKILNADSLDQAALDCMNCVTNDAQLAAEETMMWADQAKQRKMQQQWERKFSPKEPDYSNLSSGTIGERVFRTQICDRYNKNIEIEKQYLIDLMKSGAFDGHYNGQGIGMLAEMLMGPSIDEAFATNMVRNFVRELQEKYGWDLGTVAHSGCEAIAVYNVLQDLGKNISLSKIIYDAEFNQYTWLQGWAGVHPENVDDLLSLYEVEFENVDTKDIEKQLQNGNLKSGEIFIAVFYLDKNDTGPTGLIHTVEIEYAPDKNSDEPWIVYNAYNKREMEKTYTSLEDVYGKGAFKYIYEIEGVR